MTGFGNIEWKDQDKINTVLSEELPTKVAADKAYQNAIANSDEQNARIDARQGPGKGDDLICSQTIPISSSCTATTATVSPLALRDDLYRDLQKSRLGSYFHQSPTGEDAAGRWRLLELGERARWPLVPRAIGHTFP